MFVRQDDRGYYRLVENYVDQETGKHRQRYVRYLGRRPEITLARAVRESIDLEALENLVLRGDLRFLHVEHELVFRLGHDGSRWLAEESAEEEPHCSFTLAGASLEELVGKLRAIAVEAEDEAGIDSGLHVKVKLAATYSELGLRARKELRRGIYELFQPPLRLLLPAADQLPKVLNSSQALVYLREVHGLRLKKGALYCAVRRGRLSCFYGAWDDGSLGPALVRHDKSMPWARPAGRKRWPAIGFHESDLDVYVQQRYLPLRSVIALERRRLGQDGGDKRELPLGSPDDGSLSSASS